MIHFACPSCGAKLRVPDSKAGVQGHCPKCGGVMVAPEPDAPPEPSVSEGLDDLTPEPAAVDGLGDLAADPDAPPLIGDSAPAKPKVIKLVCDGCGAHLSIPVDAVAAAEARTGQCPRCGQVMTLPIPG